jgi:hypothetical protein
MSLVVYDRMENSPPYYLLMRHAIEASYKYSRQSSCIMHANLLPLSTVQ